MIRPAEKRKDKHDFWSVDLPRFIARVNQRLGRVA
jgi:hypothetical protein